MQILATILFFIVFIQLFIVLSVYLGVTLYNYFKKEKSQKRRLDEAQHHTNAVPTQEPPDTDASDEHTSIT